MKVCILVLPILFCTDHTGSDDSYWFMYADLGMLI